MLDMLDDYDWQEAFGYVGEPNTNAGSCTEVEVCPSDTYDCSDAPFTREDVACINGFEIGENDFRPWRMWGFLNDGRYFYLDAGCDYTGWDCQAGGSGVVAKTSETLIREGMTDEARRIFGIVEAPDEIKIKAPNRIADTYIDNDKSVTQYEHHGQMVSVFEALKGLHREHCLCMICTELRPGQPDNCPIAQAVFDNCVKYGLCTPMYECPKFSDKR